MLSFPKQALVRAAVWYNKGAKSIINNCRTGEMRLIDEWWAQALALVHERQGFFAMKRRPLANLAFRT